jgi:hypothetical protein
VRASRSWKIFSSKRFDIGQTSRRAQKEECTVLFWDYDELMTTRRRTYSRETPQRTTRQIPQGKRSYDEQIWIRMAGPTGKSGWYQVDVIRWGDASEGNDFGRPFVRVEGEFAFFARTWRRTSPNVCKCRVCLRETARGRPPVHAIEG